MRPVKVFAIGFDKPEKRPRMRRTAIVVLAIALGVAAYVTSLAVSASRLIDAARAGNGEEIWARTDLNRVKRSLTDQIIGAYLERAGNSARPTTAIIPSSYAASLTDAMLGKFLTAANLKNLLQSGTAGEGSERFALPPISHIDARDALAFLPLLFPLHVDEIGVRLSNDRGGDNYSAVSFRFVGTGWTLSTITLPKSIVRELANALPTR